MKKYLLLLCLCGALQYSHSQTITGFATTKDQFMKEFDNFMNANKRDDVKEAMDAFSKMVKEGKMSEANMDQMIKVCNIMALRNMNPPQHFLPYLKAVMGFLNTGKSEAQFAEWSKVLAEVIKNQKKGSNTDFQKFMGFSEDFFVNGALNIGPGKAYKVASNEYKLAFEGGVPILAFGITSFIGLGQGDSIVIRNTQGKYFPISNTWSGKGGTVDWGRVQLDPKKVYCTFNDYTVNLGNYYYTVDTVTFFHTDYFPLPLKGKLTDKIVPNSDTTHASYPRFESINQNITIKDFAPNVSYSGGFSLHGSKVIGYGTDENKAQLDFYTRDGKTKVLTAISKSITFKKGEQIGATRAAVSLYFGTDSIYHPSLNVVYKIDKREVRMLRGESGNAKAQFYDSYHAMAFETDALFWNLDSSVLQLKILSGVGQNPSLFESKEYFSKDAMRKVQGYVPYEPLGILVKLVKENSGSPYLDATKVAQALDPNLTEVQARSLFYQLIEKGFIDYDEGLSLVTIKEKTFNYVLANAKRIDYDIIRMQSLPKSGIENIDLAKNTLDLKGVVRVPISDTAGVSFFPKNNNLSIEKDRNMKFDGLIYAGRMDMIGREHHFNYAPFTTDLNNVDSMRINIPDPDGKLDAEGNPRLVTLYSKVENLKGLLEIDAPINKSGRARLQRYPRLISREKSYTFYNDPAIAGGAYNKKDFMFEIDPFTIDSLNNFSPSVINWKGRLKSNIFPDIEERLHIQEDLSLGFGTITPPEGLALYTDKGNYKGDLTLNYKGMSGKGEITHSTAYFKSDTIGFFPDSLNAKADTFTISKTFDGVQTPDVKSARNPIHWETKKDSMHVYMTDNPFDMYEGQTKLNGSLLLTQKGLGGQGNMDWAEANLASKNFNFKTENMTGDSAKLLIKSVSDGKDAFITPNVQAAVDFKARIGDFKSNLKDPIDFSYNQYKTNIKEFKWLMDQKILEFISPMANGERFWSTRADQKDLGFDGKRAIYNLETSFLRVEGVKDIRVADASVVPDSGVVEIEEAARMKDLSNATIIADTLYKTHKIENASVSILSKERLIASGDYKYVTGNLPDQTIRFNDITCVVEEVESKKKEEKVNLWHLSAKGDIGENTDFLIYPNVVCKGTANLFSQRPGLVFEGFAKINLKRNTVNHENFFIKQEVDPKQLNLKFDDKSKNNDGVSLAAGLFVNKSDVNTIYANMLAPKTEPNDFALMKLDGSIMHDSKTNMWMAGNVEKGYKGALSGNVLKFDDNTGVLKGDGKMTLGAFGTIGHLAAGSVDAKTDSGIYKFNVTFTLDANTNKDINERLAFYLFNDNVDLVDINYDKESFRKQLAELAGDQRDVVMEDFEKTLFFKRPKGLTHALVFTDVNFVWDNEDGTLRSVGKFGLAMMGDKAIHKRVEGYIEVNYRTGGDFINIYMKTGAGEWFFIEARPGVLGILPSPGYEDVTKLIAAIAPEKRVVKLPEGKSYTFTVGSSINKEDFVYRMREKLGLVGKDEAPPKPKKVDSNFENPTPADTTGGVVPVNPDNFEQPVKEEPKKEEPLNQEQKRFGQDLYKGDQGGFKLFDAPPDRGQPNQPAPTDTTKTEEAVPVVPQEQNNAPTQETPPPPVQESVPPQQETTPLQQETVTPPVQEQAPPPVQEQAPPAQETPPPPVQEQAPPPVQEQAPPVQETPPPPVQESAPPQQETVTPPAQEQAPPPVQETPPPPVQESAPPQQEATPPQQETPPGTPE